MLRRTALRIPTQLVQRRALGSSPNYVVVSGPEDKVQELLGNSSKKVLYFTATWCPPCRKIAPVFEKLSNDFPDIQFMKIDVDENQGVASEYTIQAVPTFIFKQGNTIKSKVSGANETAIRTNLVNLNNVQ